MILTLAQKELKSLFSSPIAWTAFAALQLSFAWLFLSRLDAFLNVQYQLNQITHAPGVTELVIAPTFAAAVIIMLLLTPLLSARLIADERAQKTLPLIFSAPISMTEIVLGKFLGLFVLLMMMVFVIAGTTLSLLAGGALDLGLVLSNTLGLILLCACFAAVGIYISSLTELTSIAAMGTFAVLLGLWLMGLAGSDPNSFLNQISLVKRFDSFNQGFIHSGDVVYLMVFFLTFLGLTVAHLHRDRLYA